MLALLSSCASKLSSNHLPKNVIPIEPIGSWTERQFSGATHYSLKNIDGKKILSANSNASASMLYKKVVIDLNKTPYINWRWLVNSSITSNKNEKERRGDDFPARVYIAIKPMPLDIKPRAITYVWANSVKQFDTWRNPYSKNVAMVALQSGNDKSQQWVTEKRNLKQDLQLLFNESIDSIEGIALMSDSDNTKMIVEALYSDIYFSTD